MADRLHRLKSDGLTLLEFLGAAYDYRVIPEKALEFLQGHGLLAAEEALTAIAEADQVLNPVEQPAGAHLVDVMRLMCAHFHALSRNVVRDPTSLVKAMYDVLDRALTAAGAEEDGANKGEEVANV